jgi:hypothetical protein
VLPCAGAYVAGADGSNECPAGSARIESEAACRTAAAAAGKTPGTSSPFVEKRYDILRGCYYWTDSNKAFFNTHAVGCVGVSGHGVRLLCAATGAPLTPMRRRVRPAAYDDT